MDAARRRPRADGHGNGCAALGGLSTHVDTGSHVARRAAASLVFVLVATCRSAAEACPRCAAGIEARQQVLSSDLVPTLAIAVLPFLVVGAISAWSERIGRGGPAATRAPSKGALRRHARYRQARQERLE